MNKKVCLITNIPTPYRTPLFNILSKMFRDNGLSLKVIFWAEGYGRRKWQSPLQDAQFDYTILKSWQIRLKEEWYLFIPINLFTILAKEKSAVIIIIGFSIATMLVFFFHLLIKVPYIIWSGEITRAVNIVAPFTGRKSILHSFKRLLRKMLVKNSSALITYGTKAGEYLKSLDSSKPVFYGWNTVDTQYFSDEVKKLKAGKNKIFKELKLSENAIHILTIGYLVKGKAFEQLIKALKIVKENQKNFYLHIIGDGSEKDNLIRLTTELGLTENIYFWGYKQKYELPQFFAIADFFVFPSLVDIWGLVSIEAMSCGIPVIASKYAGSTYDLIQDGVNGFIIDPYNIEEMAEKIKILIDNQELRKRMGENARKTIGERFTLEKSAQGFLEAVIYVLQKTKK